MTQPDTSAEAPDRRADLIAATMRCIAENGFADTTVERICAEAGVSRGLISHYFDGKSDLLLETYRLIAGELAAETRRAAHARGNDPLEKLRAAVEVSFRPPVFDSDRAAVWLAFWSEARTSPTINALNRDLYREYRAAFTRLMGESARARGAAIDPHRAAVGLAALIDGLWLQRSLDREAFSAEDAQAVCLDYLDRLFEAPATAASEKGDDDVP